MEKRLSEVNQDFELVCLPITSIDKFFALQHQWQLLIEESASYSFFLTWEWMSTWWEVYQTENTKLTLLVCYHNKVLVGLAPFYIDQSNNKKVLQFIGMGEAEWEEVSSMYLDIIIKTGYEWHVCKAIWSFLSKNKSLWDIAVWHDILPTSNALVTLNKQINDAKYHSFQKQVSTRFYIEMPQNWDDYIAQFSKSRRKKIRWNLNRLNSLGEVKEYSVSDENDLLRAFDELVKLHTMRWEDQGEHGVFASKRFLIFHRKLLKKVFLLNRLDLRLIAVDGEIISALYNFRYKNNIFTYQAGFHLDDNFSLGFVADILSLQAAVNSGCTIYDYMKGDEGSYKGNFQCETQPMYNLTVYNRNLVGQLNFLIEKVKNIIRPVKRLVVSR